MIIGLILCFIVLGFCLLLFKYNKTSIIVLTTTLILFILIGDGVFPVFLLKKLQGPYTTPIASSWKSKNAIIILGRGIVELNDHVLKPNMEAYSRIYEGASLYYACKKSKHDCNIILSGGDPQNMGISEAELYKNALINLGIKDVDIKIESKSFNTFQNAQFTSEILKKERYDQVFLVTSGTHLNRSLLFFKHFGIQPIAFASDYVTSKISYAPKSYNFFVTDIALHEYVGILQYYIYNYFGWNVKATKV